MSVAVDPFVTPTPASRPDRQLRLVEAPQRRRRPRLAYAVLALTGAALIAAVQIGLSMAITEDSFRVAELTQQNHELTLQAQAMSESIAGENSPQSLSVKAAELGMVVAGAPSYLRLSDGSVTGAGTPAGGVSTVNPTSTGDVPNALMLPEKPVPVTQVEEAEVTPKEPEAEVAPEPSPIPDLPPVVDGLPSPVTR